MKLFSKIALLGLVVVSTVFTACDKTKPYDLGYPASEAHFLGAENQTYSILVAAPPAYNVGVGTTDVSSSDRTITYKITSPTGATGGTHYTIPTGNTTGTITIPAGQAIGNIVVQGIAAPYIGSPRKDTLVITLSDPSVKPSTFSNVVKLVLRGPCFEGDVTTSAWPGAWKAVETFGTGAPYGPYPTAITTITNTSATTATITVTNIWDNGWGPIQFNLNWTDPANRTAIVVAQNAIPGSNAGDLNSAYAGQTVAVRAFTTPTAANTGTFSACSNTFTLRMQLGVTGVGFFAPVYEVRLSK